MLEPKPLADVRAACACYRESKETRKQTIRDARAAGFPLREIAEAAGVSVELVRRMSVGFRDQTDQRR